jgi:2-succinyl-6-hydroxy-2,4-cyclohexadiene-1-carboxylate synthase
VSARCRLVALHGFLGRASDWDALGEWIPEASIAAIDLWSVLADPRVVDWGSLRRVLDHRLAAAVLDEPAEAAFVVAYSFGARLALASGMLAAPNSIVHGCCFVSCNPRFEEADEGARATRRASDETWARRILEWPEPDIWRAWDAQPVFEGSHPPSPREGLPAPRAVLADALVRFSAGGQPNYGLRLWTWQSPVLWITGGRDTKFTAIARQLASAGAPLQFATCERAGHRVPWDDPEEFARVVRNWMAQVMETSR